MEKKEKAGKVFESGLFCRVLKTFVAFHFVIMFWKLNRMLAS
jgi:hypothetical protein